MDKLEFLSEAEKMKVEQFVNDLVMREAVRKVLLSGVYFDGIMEQDKPADPLKNFVIAAFTNQHSQLQTKEQWGNKMETIINAISLIETGFKELEKAKRVEPETKDKVINPAR